MDRKDGNDRQMIYMSAGELRAMLEDAVAHAVEREVPIAIRSALHGVGLGDDRAKSDIIGLRRFWRAKERITGKMVDTIFTGIARVMVWALFLGLAFMFFEALKIKG